MNLSVNFPLNTGIHKNLFKLKPITKEGLLLNIYNSKANRKIRFSHCTFHSSGNTVVLADTSGNFYLVDICSCKYWGLPKLDSCTVLRFSNSCQDELLVGSISGVIHIVNYETGYNCGKLEGHRFPVKHLSFNDNGKVHMCLSTTQNESIIWDMETYTKIQVLNLDKNIELKFVLFIPASCYILACFHDDLIQIWDSNGYNTVKQFLPVNWKNQSIRSLAFTRSGQIMAVAGYLPKLAIFKTDLWKLSKIINLPEYIQTVKYINFVPQPFDGGANRILAILSGQGIIYFCDIENNHIISELYSKCEINKFYVCPKGSYISCILCLGEVEIYNLSLYLTPPVAVKAQSLYRKVNIQRSESAKNIQRIKSEISNVLDIDRLRMILRQFGQYPDEHRIKIWERLLELPNNYEQYNSIINYSSSNAFDGLEQKYPLENSLLIRSVKKLLNNLVTWCPFFAKVEYLPSFVFPFVKVLNNKPPQCFEVTCTIILNWCQHWFEYFPLPPKNILSIIENLIYEHDPELLNVFLVKGITTHVYAWPLLQTAFFEVLTPREWLQFWDHILSNEPSLLLCSVAAYSILQRNILFSLKKPEDYNYFYQNRNPIDIRRFVKLSYGILMQTSENLHPSQYLQEFQRLKPGNYPVFIDYPKTIFDFQSEELDKLDRQLEQMAEDKLNMISGKSNLQNKYMDKDMVEEERRRLLELEKIYLQHLKTKKEFVRQECEKLDDLRRSSTNKAKMYPNRSKQESSDNDRLAKVIKAKEEYLTRLKDLLKYRNLVEDMLEQEKVSGNLDNQNLLQKHRKYIEKQARKISQSFGPSEDLEKLNISAGLEVLELLIKKVETELKSGKCESQGLRCDTVPNIQRQTKHLEREIAKLLGMLAETTVPQHQTIDSHLSKTCNVKDADCNCHPSCKSVRFN